MKKSWDKQATIVANALSTKDKRIRVVFGNTACTDGDVITLPGNLPEGDLARESILAFLLHECAHIRWSDFKLLTTCAPSVASLANSVEDSRIEKLLRKEYFGAHYYLERQYERMVPAVLRQKLNLLETAGSYMFCKLSDESPVLQDAAKKLRRRLVNIIGGAKAQELDRILGYPLSMSLHSFTMAASAIKVLADHLRSKQTGKDSKQSVASKAKDNPASDESSAAGNGAQSDSRSQNARGAVSSSPESAAKGNACSSEHGRQNPDSSGDSDRSADGKSSSGSCGSGADKAQCDRWPDKGPVVDKRWAEEMDRAMKELNGMPHKVSPMSLSDTVKDALKNNRLADSSDKPDQILDRSYGHGCSFEGISVSDQEVLESGGEEVLKTGRLVAAGVGRGLTGLIASETVRRNRSARAGCKVQANRLCRLKAGDSRVFLKKGEEKGVDTAICILLDRSGSMGHDSTCLAVKAAVGLFLALRRIRRVKSAIAQFPTPLVGEREQAGARNCTVTCGFNDDPRKRLKNFGVLSFPRGGTPIHEAIGMIAALLNDRPEKRKVLVVMTDGCFYFSKDVKQALDKLGIELAFLFIGEKPRGEAVHVRHAVVSRYEQIAEAIFKIARQLAPGVNHLQP